MKPKFLWFFPLFLGNQIVNFVQSDSPFFFSFERPRRLKELKTLYTLLWLYQIFWRRRWMWNSADWEWRLSERKVSERRGWVSERGWGAVWEWEGEWERESVCSVLERWWVRVESVWSVWNALILKKPQLESSLRDSVSRFSMWTNHVRPRWPRHITWVSETQVPGVLHMEFCHIKLGKLSLKDSIYRLKIESLKLEMLVNNIVSELDLLTI